MKTLPKNYVVECTTAEETKIVNNYFDKDEKDWNYWKYITVSETDNNIFKAETDYKKWFKQRRITDYELLTFKEWNEIVNIKNKSEMKKQTLTKNQLIDLREQFSCSIWKAEIDKILTANILNKGFKYEIPEDSIKLLQVDGSDLQKEAITKLGFKLPKTDKELYLEGQANCGLKIGDKIKVIRTTESRKSGWCQPWNDSMNSSVGKTFIIKDFGNDDNGFQLENNYWYPYFVLEKVVEEWIPFTFEDDLLGKQVIAKDKSCKAVISYQNVTCIIIGDETVEYDELLEDYTFLDGTPCGKLKQ